MILRFSDVAMVMTDFALRWRPSDVVIYSEESRAFPSALPPITLLSDPIRAWIINFLVMFCTKGPECHPGRRDSHQPHALLHALQSARNTQTSSASSLSDLGLGRAGPMFGAELPMLRDMVDLSSIRAADMMYHVLLVVQRSNSWVPAGDSQ